MASPEDAVWETVVNERSSLKADKLGGEGRDVMFVAIGRTGRGKSTTLNKLLGQQVPTGSELQKLVGGGDFRKLVKLPFRVHKDVSDHRVIAASGALQLARSAAAACVAKATAAIAAHRHVSLRPTGEFCWWHMALRRGRKAHRITRAARQSHSLVLL